MRIEDKNGFVEYPNTVIAKSGIFDYLGSEINAPEPLKTYRVLVSDEELAKAASGFKGMPLTNGHAMIGKGGLPVDKRPLDGVIGDNVVFKAGKLLANIRLYTDKIKELIDKGKRELSTGYYSRFLFESGSWNGQQFDARQVDLRPNHLALVDAGRMGSECLILNSKPEVSAKLIFTLNGKPMENQPENPPENPQHEQAEMHTLDSLATQLAGLTALCESLHSKVDAIVAKPVPVENEDDDKQELEKKEDKEGEDDKDEKEVMNAALTSDIKKIAEKLIGVFNSKGLSPVQVADYACRKLGLKDFESDPVTSLKAAAMVKTMNTTPKPLAQAAQSTEIKPLEVFHS